MLLRIDGVRQSGDSKLDHDSVVAAFRLSENAGATQATTSDPHQAHFTNDISIRCRKRILIDSPDANPVMTIMRIERTTNLPIR